MDDVVEVYGDFLVRRYPNERSSRVQWDAFNAWVKREKLSGLATWRVQAEESYLIVVFDLTGRAPEFAWAGEPWGLHDSNMEAFMRRAEDWINAGGGDYIARFPPGTRLRRTAEGRFAIPVNRG
jgi:hypothetical protein